MKSQLLEYYERELSHLFEMGVEFGKEYRAVASGLGLGRNGSTDPYVERLLEAFAFLAARVKLKIDEQYPYFVQQLFDTIYPDYLTPTPSLAIVRLNPKLNEGSLADGFIVPRDTNLYSVEPQQARDDRGRCIFRTTQDVTLWPIELAEAVYLTRRTGFGGLDIPSVDGVEAALLLRFRAVAGLMFDKLPIEQIPLFLQGALGFSMQLYEELLARNAIGLFGRVGGTAGHWVRSEDENPVRSLGFDDAQAMFPVSPRSFSGYRLLREYFSLPERYLFVELRGLRSIVRSSSSSEIELAVLLRRERPSLVQMVDAASFALFCTPAINLFPKEKIAVDVNRRRFEHHLVPERTQPMDFEVYRVNAVKGPGTSGKRFLPLYSPKFLRAASGQNLACFTVRREPRRVSSRTDNEETRSEYLGSEVFLTLADSSAPPHNDNLNRVFVDTLCTNRGSPLLLGNTDFEPPRTGAPVESVSTIVGPTPPKPSLATIMQRDATGSTGSAWRLVSHLSLGYLPMQDRDDPDAGVGAVREWLRLYGDQADPALQRQIDGVVGVSFRPIVRPITPRQRDSMCLSSDDSASIPYWLTACARGLEITVTCDETHFVGYGLFLFGAVLEQVFARYVSINSLTETVLKTTKGVEVMRWPARDGTKVVL